MIGGAIWDGKMVDVEMWRCGDWSDVFERNENHGTR